MQASVHEFDDQSACGSVLTDEGLRLPFDEQAFATSRLRLLRPGQRLTVDVVDGVVVALRIVGI